MVATFYNTSVNGRIAIQNSSNWNTYAKMLPCWQKNVLWNSALSYSDLINLKGAEAGNTIGIVAGGDSLKRNMSDLQSCPFPLMVVDRLYNRLSEQGVKFKYVVAIDGIAAPIGEGKGEKLIFDIKCNSALVREWQGERYGHIGGLVSQRSNAFEVKFATKIAETSPKLSIAISSGNVATRALVIAREILKAKRIVLISQDYCDHTDFMMKKMGSLYTYLKYPDKGYGERYVFDAYERYAAFTREYIDGNLANTDFVVTETDSLINDVVPDHKHRIMPLNSVIKIYKKELKYA